MRGAFVKKNLFSEYECESFSFRLLNENHYHFGAQAQKTVKVQLKKPIGGRGLIGFSDAAFKASNGRFYFSLTRGISRAG